jgi:hypothetical protein
MFKISKTLLAGASLALTLPLVAHAQYRDDERRDDWREQEHRHPHYVHAMADVSAAFLLIKHARGDPAALPEEERAMVAIEYAFTTLKNAADVVQKDSDDIPPVQDHHTYDHRERLHRALDLLHDAHDQVDRGEEDPDARGQKHRALEQIDGAAHFVEAAIRAMNY